MPRPKGSKNKIRQMPAEQFSLTTDERLELIASLIVEKIFEDQRSGIRLLDIFGAHDVSTNS